MFRPLQGHNQTGCIQNNTNTANCVDDVRVELKYNIIN